MKQQFNQNMRTSGTKARLQRKLEEKVTAAMQELIAATRYKRRCKHPCRIICNLMENHLVMVQGKGSKAKRAKK